MQVLQRDREAVRDISKRVQTEETWKMACAWLAIVPTPRIGSFGSSASYLFPGSDREPIYTDSNSTFSNDQHVQTPVLSWFRFWLKS